MKRNTLIFLILITLNVRCVFDSEYKQELIAPYYLGVDYSTNQVCVHWRENSWSGGIEKIPARIVELGWDKKFILVKQESLMHPRENKYYIIHVYDTAAQCDSCVMGPMNEDEFLRTRNRLQIPEKLQFKWRVSNFKLVEIHN